MCLQYLILLFFVASVDSWSHHTTFTPSGNDKIYCLDYSADGTKLVVGGQAKKVIIYETTSYTTLGTYNAPEIPRTIKFSPDGNYIAMGFQIDDMDILSGSTYSMVKRLSTGHSKVHDIDFREDSGAMITCGDDKKFKVWNPSSSWVKTHQSSDLGDVLWKCVYAYDNYVAIGLDPGPVRLYNPAFSSFTTHSPSASGKPYGVDFKYGTHEIIMGSDNSKAYYLTDDSSPLRSMGGIVWEAKYARTNEYFMFGGEDYKVYIYNSTKNLIYTFTEPSKKVYSADFTPDGCSLAAGTEGNKIYIYTNVQGSCDPTPPTPPSGGSNTTNTTNSTNTTESQNNTQADPSAGNCSIYTAGMKGCAICYNQTVCHECSVGYYLNTFSLCSTCAQSMTGCGVCNSSSVCIYCLPGYYLNGGNTCSTCDSVMEGCLFCQDAFTCQECHNDFYLNTGTCDSCTNIPNCLKCSSSSDCLQCTIGFYADNMNACQPCASNCVACQSDTNCTSCGIGFYLMGGVCNPCSGENCLACNGSDFCLDCTEGTFIDANGNCEACSSPCSSCNGSQCLSCQTGYLDNGLCQNCPTGCDECSSNSVCSSCESSYTLVGSSCLSCQDQIQGCFSCSDASTCVKCFGGLFESGGNCVSCSSTMEGCQRCSDSSTCQECENGYFISGSSCSQCESSLEGCQSCENSTHCSDCSSGYFVGNSDSCELCSDQLSGCIMCSSSSNCVLCSSEYTLNTGNGLCEMKVTEEDNSMNYCQLSYCLTCQYNNITNITYCLGCIPTHYLDGNGDCQDCSSAISGCAQCTTSATCALCDVGFYSPSGTTCQLCSDSMTGCTLCNSSSSCLQCQSGYYIDTNGLCEICSSSLEGCLKCSDESNCQECKSRYFLNSSSCQPCTDLPGCSFCTDISTCFSCEVTYYLLAGQCHSCESSIQNCFDCSSASTCKHCKSGYRLRNGACEEISFSSTSDDQSQQVVDMSLSLKTYYVSQFELKHILFVRGTQFSHTNVDWSTTTSMFLEDPNGEKVQLIIESVEWGDNFYSLILYTNNPYKITIDDIAKMNFTRRLLTGPVTASYKVQLDMDESTLSTVLPDYSHSGSLQLSYSLDKPEFVASVVKGVNNYFYHLFGIIVIFVLFIGYLIKATCTVPKSHDLGQVTSHIFAMKCGALILFPTYVEYFDYCSGFMNADFPWANSAIGKALGNESDDKPFAYAVFYSNMNFASMYLIAFSVILLLALIVFIVFKRLNNKEKMMSCFKFLYCFFIFGITVAGCASLQGIIMNPVSTIDGNSAFYVLGFFLYILVFLECCYFLKKNLSYLWKARIFIKATLLSLGHLNPVFLVSLAIFIDIALAIAEYKTTKSKPNMSRHYPYPKLWLIDHILCNVALGILILLPIILLSLVLVSIILVYVILAELFIHIQELKASLKVNEEKEGQKSIIKTEENILSEDKKSINLDRVFDQESLGKSERDKSQINKSEISERNKSQINKTEIKEANAMNLTEYPFMQEEIQLDSRYIQSVMSKSPKKRKQRKKEPKIEEPNADIIYIDENEDYEI